MALWGKYDDKTSTGTIEVHANGLVEGTSTEFDTESRVGDYLVVNSSVGFVVSSIETSTEAHVVAAVPGTSVNAVSSGTNYTLHEAPKYVSFAEGADSAGYVGDYRNVFGVDVDEAAAARAGAGPKAAHAGWVRKIEGTGGRAGRVSYEVLVAGSSIDGDAEDASFPDAYVNITVQPQDATANSSDDEQANFSVTAVTVPAGGSITYLWYYTTEVGNTDSFATTAAVSGFADQTTDTLVVDANTIADGTMVRAVLSSGGYSGNTADATLTVTS